jgi:methyltransferase family protein
LVAEIEETMGLNEHFLGLMIGLQKQGHLKGRRVMEIGAQQLSDAFLRDRRAMEELARLLGKSLADLPNLPASTAGIAPGDEPYSRVFYQALGYDYTCVDIDGSPDAVPLDLNYDEAPAEHRGKYDLVTNFGTTEHIMNQLNSFKVIHDLTAVGGVMIHELPTQGLLDHGLFNYNPKFFRFLGENNGYETLFLDYRWTEIRTGLSENLKYQIEKYTSIADRPLCGVSEAVLFVAQRKARDGPFIPPVDVPLGATPPSAVIADRYWPVFKPPGGIAAIRRLVKRLVILALTGR